MEFNFIIFFLRARRKIKQNIPLFSSIVLYEIEKGINFFLCSIISKHRTIQKKKTIQIENCLPNNLMNVMLCYVCDDDETNQIKMAIGNFCYLNLFLFLKRKINLTPFSPYNKKKSSPYIQWTLDNHTRLGELKKNNINNSRGTPYTIHPSISFN